MIRWIASISTACCSSHWPDVKQNPLWHPEEDALYHSLQVFELARRQMSWMKNSCWQPCCTMLARRSPRTIT